MSVVTAREGAAGRRVEVPADRVQGWLTRFAERHGEVTTVAGPEEVVATAADGAVAYLQVPFPPLAVDAASPDRGIAAHALLPRRVGVLLVRLGGHAVGVFDGDRLVTSKVGSRQVHGRSAAGGWSQQRFARRREGQVRVALGAAADLAVTLLVPVAATLDAVVLGGDRRSVDTVLADVRLAPLRPLVVPPLLDVPDPRRAVLDSAPGRFRTVRIVLVDAPSDT
jgi:Actinobacteria/chloroflexi VLRF1 release factor